MGCFKRIRFAIDYDAPIGFEVYGILYQAGWICGCFSLLGVPETTCFKDAFLRNGGQRELEGTDELAAVIV